MEAKKRGAELVILVDTEPEMVDFEGLDTAEIFFFSANMHNLGIRHLYECDCERDFPWQDPDTCNCFKCRTKFEGADVVFCRQAVNYWLWDDMAARNVARIAKRGSGKFIFNTFNTKPSEEPTVKKYEMGTALSTEWSKYVEVSWLVDDICHHVQIREGMAPHVTEFKWIPPEQFQELLEVWFDIETKVDGPSTIYTCTRREKKSA